MDGGEGVVTPATQAELHQAVTELRQTSGVVMMWIGIGLGINALREGDGKSTFAVMYLLFSLVVFFLILIFAPNAHAQSCGSAGCTDHYTTLSNQGGGWKPCQTNSVEGGIPTQVSADNAGSYSDHQWNYIVSGHLNVNNPNRKSALVHLKMLMGQGQAFVAEDELITIEQGFHQIEFRGFEPNVPPQVYVGFWVYLTSDRSIGCISTDYLTEEHD